MDIGLLIVRLVVGVTLAAHGAQKLFGWFGGGGIAGTGAGLEHLGFRPGRVHAALAGVVEVGAGLFVAAGFLTPAASAAVFAVMIVAAVSAHLRNGFFAQNGGFEYAFVLGSVGLGLAFTGPGDLSVDHALGLSWSGPSWGAVALATGLVGGTIPLLGRRMGDVPPAQHAA